MTDISSIPAYVATLENSPRHARLNQELTKLPFKEVYLNVQTRPTVKSHLTATVECTKNHLGIYKRALEKGFSRVCVLEDDIYTTKDLPKTLDLPEEWDLVYLGYVPVRFLGSVGRVNGSGALKIREGIFWCTHAYLISEKAMKFVLRHTPEEILDQGRKAVPVLFDYFFIEGGGIDTFLAYWAYRGVLKSFCVYPMAIYQYSIPLWEQKARACSSIANLTPGYWLPNVMVVGLLILQFILFVLLNGRR